MITSLVKPSKLALFAILLAFALIIQTIENLYLPAIPIPGVKLGLANIITLLMLPYFGFLDILLAVFLRVVLSSLFTGSFLASAFYFSLSGGVISFLVMYIAYKLFLGKVSYAGISILGASTHNIAQLTVAYFLIGSWAVFLQIPLLLGAAAITGLFLGLLANICQDRLQKQIVDFGH